MAIYLGKPCWSYPLPVSSGCSLIAFKGHFSSAESQYVLFIPLSQTVKRVLCKKHPKERNVINPNDAGEQLSHRALTHSTCEIWVQSTSHCSKLLLGKAFPPNDLSAWAAIFPCWSHSSSLLLPSQPLSDPTATQSSSCHFFWPYFRQRLFLSYLTKLYQVHKALKGLKNSRRKCVQITFAGVNTGCRFPAPFLAQMWRCVPHWHNSSKQQTEYCTHRTVCLSAAHTLHR